MPAKPAPMPKSAAQPIRKNHSAPGSATPTGKANRKSGAVAILKANGKANGGSKEDKDGKAGKEDKHGLNGHANGNGRNGQGGNPGIDKKKLLAVLEAFKEGNFLAKLDDDFGGIDGRICAV